jgi:Arc/MetJ-type ribon-helix-helix transcriptional regulator
MSIMLVSGKMGSGKDSVIKKAGLPYASISSFIRADLDQVILECVATKAHEGILSSVVKAVSRVSGLDPMHSAALARDVVDVTKTDPSDEALQSAYHPLYRTALQKLGSTYRPLGFYTQQAINHCNKSKVSVISGGRYKKECDVIRAASGLVVRIEAPEDIRIERLTHRDGRPPTREELNHPSETELNDYDFDFIIDNTGTVDESAYLLREVYNMLNN